MSRPEVIDFKQALQRKFFELRPLFDRPDIDTSPETLIANPIFIKLLIIDRTMTNPEIFEAGYLLWEELHRDTDKFLAQFEVTVKDGNLLVTGIEPVE